MEDISELMSDTVPHGPIEMAGELKVPSKSSGISIGKVFVVFVLISISGLAIYFAFIPPKPKSDHRQVA